MVMKRFGPRLAFALLSLMAVVPAGARVCGTQYLQQHRERFGQVAPKLLVPQQESGKIEAGTQLNFLVFNRTFTAVATCRYVGEHCYIFVEDSHWEIVVMQADVDRLGELFDRSTPADPERGMYDLEVEAFGPPPDVDGDERIFIVVVDVDEPTLIGFFDHQVAKHPNPALRRDAIYLDASTVAWRNQLAHGTLAHELQHLIHWGHDEDEEAWVDEGLAGYAEKVTGFPEVDSTMVPGFLAQPDLNLTLWPIPAEAANYGSTYLFISFLAERHGAELIRQVVAEPRNGTFGIDEAFRKMGWVQDFDGAWARWIVANYAADDDLYGYAALKGRRVMVFPAPAPPFDAIEGNVSRQWGTTNIIFRQPGSIAVEFSGEEVGRYSVWGYAMRGETGEVVAMELDAANRGEIEVAEVDSLAVIVGRTSLQGRRFYLSASELAITAVSEERNGLPPEFRLGAAYPNPFNGYALIPFSLPFSAEVELSLYNSLGQRVRILRQGLHAPGFYQARWDGRDAAGNPLGSGAYLAVLRAGDRRTGRRMSLVK